jgi:hypothetical protein
VSHAVTVHVKDTSVREVLSVVSRYCGTQFAKKEDVEWELWKSYVFAIDVSIYDIGDSLSGDDTEFGQYPVVVSLHSSHAGDEKKALMQYAALLLAREVGSTLGKPWIVALESSTVIERSPY